MIRVRLGILVILLPIQLACWTAEPPPTVRTLVLEGTPYQRGYRHGEQLSAHIRSLYTRLLESSILPYLNREQLNIAPILTEYGKREYLDGQFSYRMLLESGQYLFEHHLPEEYRQELRGIADGAGMPLEEVLVLNTFFDTMMAFRAIVLFIQYIQEPYVESLSAIEGPETDGRDNDGDGEVDEPGEGHIEPYGSIPHAALVEIPVNSRIRIVLRDPTLAGLACVDPRNAEPLGDLGIDRACIEERCVLPDCRDQERVDRDCLAPAALNCIEPRVAGDCLLPACVESTDPGCVDPDSIRIQVDNRLYLPTDEAVTIRLIPDGEASGCKGALEVVFRQPGGFRPASVVTLTIGASDQSPIYSPEPFHHRTMRDERIVFTTEGFGAEPSAVPNRGPAELPVRPPPIAFGVRGTAASGGTPLLAHHFTLLDSGIVHEHTVLFVHVPDGGHPHAVLGWAGVAWGFSGMNDQGLAYTLNHSDTLDNPLTGHILRAILEPDNLARLIAQPDLEGLAEVLTGIRLVSSGLPGGFAGRELLTRASSTREALELLYRTGRTYGWNLLLVDADGDLVGLELDAAALAEDSGTGPEPMDEDGFQLLEPGGLGSTGADDLRMAGHFAKNTDDMEDLPLLASFAPRPQRLWSGYYFRSLSAYHLLGDRIAGAYGSVDVAGAIDILRTPDLVDRQDSMNACVFEPADRRLHWAMGGVPATDQPFVPFDLQDALTGGEAP